jgi:hypothetical protein
MARWWSTQASIPASQPGALCAAAGRRRNAERRQDEAQFEWLNVGCVHVDDSQFL